MTQRPARALRWLAAAALAAATLPAAGQSYTVHNLVSDGTIPAEHTDPHLVNPWGLAFDPAAFAWTANNRTGTATMYDGAGNPQPPAVNIPSIVAGTGGTPTGVVFNGGSDFRVNNAPARFIFAGEDGIISAWNSGTQAVRAVVSSGPIYKGVALANTAGGARLYAANFHNGSIDVFDGNFAPVGGVSFLDPNLPAGYAPYNIASIGGRLLVTYALQNGAGTGAVPGPGHGFVDSFDTSGNLLGRFATQGTLNSPWGMAVAPADFGPFSGALLVGNSGDGTISAFDPTSGAFLGQLHGAGGATLTIDGLWGLAFGNGLFGQDANALFFTAGPGGGTAGLYGRIGVVPAPGALVLLLCAVPTVGRRRR